MSDKVFYGLAGLLVVIGVVFAGLLIANQGDNDDQVVDYRSMGLDPGVVSVLATIDQQGDILELHPVRIDEPINKQEGSNPYRIDESSWCVRTNWREDPLPGTNPNNVIIAQFQRDGEWVHDTSWWEGDLWYELCD